MIVDATGAAAAAAVAGDAGPHAGDAYGTGADALGGAQEVFAGHDVSFGSDVALFGDSLEAARRLEVPTVSPVAEALLDPLGDIDRRAAELGEDAATATASGGELTPGEILDLTVRSQEFMFHSQLTANVANRTADGLQQLFRQQG